MVTTVLLFFLPNALASSPPSNDSEASVFRLFDVLKTTTVKICMLFTPLMISWFPVVTLFCFFGVVVCFSVLWCETLLGFGIIQSVNSHAAPIGPLRLWEFGCLWV